MKNLIIAAGIYLSALSLHAQNTVGIGTDAPNQNAVLELVSPTSDQGLLVPRMTSSERNAASFLEKLSESDQALLVYDITEKNFFFWNGAEWKQVGSGFMAGKGILITESGAIVNEGDLDSLNEIQDLILSNDLLKITNNNSATSINLSTYLDNTDDQIASEVEVTSQNGISSTNVQAALEEIQSEILTEVSKLTNDAGYITSPNDSDADPGNEIQALNFSQGVISLSNDPNNTLIDISNYDTDATDDFSGDYQDLINAPDLSGYLTAEVDGDINNEIQALNFSQGVISLSNDPNNTLIDISNYDTNATDDFSGDYQDLINTPDLSGYLTAEVDGDVNNEIQALNFSQGVISLSNDPNNTLIDISNYDTDATDDFSGDYLDLINAPDLSGYLTAEVDGDVNNEIQDLTLSGNSLSITGNPSATIIDLAPYSGTNTDNQNLSYSGGLLSISGGNEVDISSVNTDQQTISFDGSFHTLSISGGNSVDLSALAIDEVDDADADNNNELQSLNFLSGQLSLSMDPSQAVIDFSNYDTDVSDDFSGDYNDLINQPLIPSDVSDLSDNSSLLFSGIYNDLSGKPDFNGWDTDVSDDFDGDFGSLINVPSDLADGDDDTTLDEATVDAYVANNGYLTSYNETDPTVPASVKDGISWSEVSGKPSYLTDGDDTFGADYVILTGADFSLYEDSETGSVQVVYGLNNSYIGTGEVGGTMKFYAPVDLPHNSRIKSIMVVGEGNDYTVAMYSYGLGADAVSKGATQIASSVVAVKSALSDYGVQQTGIVIDKSKETYFVMATGESASNMRLYQVIIAYEPNK